MARSEWAFRSSSFSKVDRLSFGRSPHASIHTRRERMSHLPTSSSPPSSDRPKKTSSSQGLFVQSQHTSISLGKRGRTIDLKALYVLFAWPKGSIHPDLVPGESVYGLGDRVPLPLILGMNARGGRGSNSRPPKSKRPPSIPPRRSLAPRPLHDVIINPGSGRDSPLYVAEEEK